MESRLIGSFPKPLPSLSFRVSADLSSSSSTGQDSTCRAWSIPEKQNTLRFQLATHHNGRIDERSVFKRRHETKFLVNAASEQPFEYGVGAHHSNSPWKSLQDAFVTFYKFSRPYAIKGTIISIISVSILAIEKLSDFSPSFLIGVLQAIVAAVLINIYISGFNQLTDIDIDKINKPYLPLASGELSSTAGVIIVSSCAMLGFWLTWIVGSWPLFWTIFNLFLFGTIYSAKLPMLRWKSNSFLALVAILGMRLGNQFGFFLHVQSHVFGRPAIFPKPLIFAAAFVSLLGVAIGLLKDLPDVDGDKLHGIQTLTVRLGQKRMFWICVSLLEAAYVIAMFVGAASPYSWSRYATVLGHAALAAILWNRARSIDLKNKAELLAFYFFIWELFYAEYLLIPLIR